MSKISKALERAKQERREAQANGGAAGVPVASGSANAPLAPGDSVIGHASVPDSMPPVIPAPPDTPEAATAAGGDLARVPPDTPVPPATPAAPVPPAVSPSASGIEDAPDSEDAPDAEKAPPAGSIPRPGVPGGILMPPPANAMAPATDELGGDNMCILHPSMGPTTSSGKAVYAIPSMDLIRAMAERQELLERNRIMRFMEDASTVDFYNFIRTQVLQRTREQGWNTIMVTSTGRREGKTLTSINLALSMSREARQTALLVDANLRHPAVGQTLGIDEHAIGLSDYLFNEIDVPDLLIDPGLSSRMRVIVAGRPLVESTDVLSLPKAQGLITELKDRYPDRYVIFDCPHIKNMPDALMFASYVDAVVLVIEAGSTAREQITESLSLLRKANIVGLVFNRGQE